MMKFWDCQYKELMHIGYVTVALFSLLLFHINTRGASASHVTVEIGYCCYGSRDIAGISFA